MLRENALQEAQRDTYRASEYLVRLVSPFNDELSFIMAAVLWSDRFVNKKLRKFKHRRKTF